MAENVDVHFMRITARTVLAVCRLSDTLRPEQRPAVADNAISIAQAHFSENAWFRAIYADEELVGFIMLHFGSDYDDGIDLAGAFLWRLMIAGPHQGKGYGKLALRRLIDELKARGMHELYTSCHLGEGSPLEFYKRFGFVETGELYGDEAELVYRFEA